MENTDIKLVADIQNIFRTRGLRVCIAESCTGGLISHLLTGQPGASIFFDSSVVCYSNESKRNLLGISTELINKYGVISEEMARAMAVSVRKARNTDFSLATTGNLGPDTMEDKEAGLVYAAVDYKGGTVSRQLLFNGGRALIKLRAAMASLELLLDTIKSSE